MKSKTTGIAVLVLGLAALSVAPAVAAEIVGSPRADRLEGTAGRDSVDALAGADVVWTYRKGDWVQGKQGDDRLYLGAGNDRACGGAGDDLIVGGEGNDRLRGGICPAGYVLDGFDVVVGGDGRDDLLGTVQYGGKGSDFHFVDGHRPVRVFAGRGDDTVEVEPRDSARRDVIRCGPGRDHLNYWIKRDRGDVVVGCEVIQVWEE